MTITAKVIADSLAPNGKRITTFELHYPRFIHAELLVHRVFSRNSASSRAIPSKKIIQQVKDDTAMPVFWGANRPGMSADHELNGWRLWLAKFVWLRARDCAVLFTNILLWLGLHKQIANRIIEPWFNITIILTSTEWGNWYNLRNHPDAQPEIQRLAEVMLEAHNTSIPRKLSMGEWHLPYITDQDCLTLNLEAQLKTSVARCARVSYLNHDGKKASLDENLKMFARLLGNFPVHASPSEHQATPLPNQSDRSGNFLGWEQFRKQIPNEHAEHYSKLKEY